MAEKRKPKKSDEPTTYPANPLRLLVGYLVGFVLFGVLLVFSMGRLIETRQSTITDGYQSDDVIMMVVQVLAILAAPILLYVSIFWGVIKNQFSRRAILVVFITHFFLIGLILLLELILG